MLRVINKISLQKISTISIDSISSDGLKLCNKCVYIYRLLVRIEHGLML